MTNAGLVERGLSRREAGRLALAGLIAATGSRPAAAQQGVVVAPPMPCLAREADIVALLLDGTGAPAGTIVSFGQAFRRGDLPRGAALTARSAAGATLPVQADIKTRHPDGSARFAVVSLAAPGLRSGERLGVLLGRGPAREEPVLDVVAAAAGRSAVIEIAPADGGEPWRADLLPRMADAVAQRARGAVWQSGPLAAQARVQLLVPRAVLGPEAGDMRLVADLALRADGTLWCAIWLRNDIAMTPKGGIARYAMRLLLDGRAVLESGPLWQAQYQGWGRTRLVARGGRDVIPPFVRHDVRYLAATGAVPPFDLSIGVEEASLARMAAAMARSDWQAPFNPRGIAQWMPMAGGRGDIGPTTRWQADWLMSGDARAAQFVLGQAEAAGAVPWHHWDAANGTWLNTDNYPKLWTDARGGTGRPGDPKSTGLVQQSPGWREVNWAPDAAHQPELSAVPYVLTGERWILDNLQAQASAGIMMRWPGPRLEGQGLVVNDGQVRAGAWVLRTIDNAAWLSPDGTPEQAYFQKISDNNWSWLVSKIPEWTAWQGEAHGWLPSSLGQGMLAPWQQDFFATTAATAARRGNEKARTFLEWQANFLIGRFTHAEDGFNPAWGTGNGLIFADPGNPAQSNYSRTPYRTWAEIATQMVARGLAPAPKDEWASFNYNQMALATLALIHHVTGMPEAERVHGMIRSLGVRGSAVADYRRDSTYAYALRSMPGPGCSPPGR